MIVTVTGDVTMDSDHDGDGNGRWLTYGEIAAARGTSRIAAVRLTQRHKWRRQKGNDGFARVLVPHDMLQPERAGPSDQGGNTDGNGDGDRHMLAGALAALEAALTEANKRADVAQVLADRTLAELADAHTRTDSEIALLRENIARSVALIDGFRLERDQAQQALEGERARADALRDRLDAAEVQVAVAETAAELARRHAQEAQDAADAARRADDDAWKARGRWARLRAAWRGD